MRTETSRWGRAAALSAGLMTIAALLTGCSSNGALRDTESRLDELPGVTGSFAWTSYDGGPTNRRMSVRVYVDEDPEEELGALIDATLETAWSFTGFEPSGVGAQVVLGARPEDPVAASWEGRLVLEDALPGIGLDIDDVGVPSWGDVISVPKHVMADRYGDWPSSAD